MYFADKMLIIHNLSFQICFVKRKDISDPPGYDDSLGNTNFGICSSPYTVGNGDSCMNSHYPLISKHKHLCSSNGVLMSWQKWGKMVSRICEWLSGNEDKDKAAREQARERKKEIISYGAQLSKPTWSSASTCFQKPRFPTHLHAISLKTRADLWLTKYKPLLLSIPSQRPQ